MLNNGILAPFLKTAYELMATDLHMCVGSKPLLRTNGKLTEISDAFIIEPSHLDEIIDTLLNENQKAELANKKVIDFSSYLSDVGRFRANIYSQRGTYAIAIRILPFTIPNFSELGLPDSVKSFTTKSRGLFLITGATGCGKSTTLASLINILNETYPYHILTVEDPIEYLHKHNKCLITQREIGTDTESFASALRSALREDPDVIMVGEMRDPETISIALTAAETGHLVFSTLHTVGAAKSIDRIIDAFPSEQQTQVRSQLASVLEGIVSQQLLPRADKKGLVIASEVMLAVPAIRSMIREGKNYQINSVIQTGQSQGMHLMDMDLANLYITGVIDEETACLRMNDNKILLQLKGR